MSKMPDRDTREALVLAEHVVQFTALSGVYSTKVLALARDYLFDHIDSGLSEDEIAFIQAGARLLRAQQEDK